MTTTFWTSVSTGVVVLATVVIVVGAAGGKEPTAKPINLPKLAFVTCSCGPLVVDGNVIAEPAVWPAGSEVGKL